ncbi:protein SODIUM POTASSIUM ROOT DEFECTIVE 1 [Cynara cardunculus var. scolymus]|uniref:HMA domain-containing protein n=1 Tax=Cynara cardunculus var. scolymus TaxID=59895 RepID=A0A103Y6T1_CYNCS|nr:protein SODIUM POTASSIUM ROOT DEFECTIVE 1 [Cynara cardunculus var. scolymus]KVI03578.1 hypothetical protein Ccrd_018122 [Cynara cardunculus var. scolymus]
MKIKTAELFCASPASTAICTTMNQHAMVRRGGGGGGGGSTPRPINHRHHHQYYNNHYQFDFGDKPKFKVPAIPCTSQHHIDPKPYTAYLQKIRKSTSSATTTSTTTATAKSAVARIGDEGALVARRKSSADINDRDAPRGSSSRYLLNNPTIIEDLQDSDDVCNAGALVVSEPAWPEYQTDSPVIKKSLSSSRRSRGYDSPALVKSRSPSLRLDAPTESPGSKSSRSRSRDQVVELRVSIHCKGCEGKVRKHISRMEGVKSFHIDLESKKVTVVGDVTPLSVLSSISKVKNAQFWPSPSPTSASASPSPTPFVAIGY